MSNTPSIDQSDLPDTNTGESAPNAMIAPILVVIVIVIVIVGGMFFRWSSEGSDPDRLPGDMDQNERESHEIFKRRSKLDEIPEPPRPAKTEPTDDPRMKLFARRLQEMQDKFEQQQAMNLELQKQLVAGSSSGGSDEEEQKAALELIKARDRATATTLYDGSAQRQVAAMSKRVAQDRVAGTMAGLPIDSMGGGFGGGDDSSSQVSQFLGNYAEPDTAYGQRIARPDLTVGKGEIITVLNDTAINTEQPGMVRGRVTSDVWSMDMGCILIPAGSKVISEARSGVQAGGERIAVVGVTIRTPAPDFVTININSMAADGVGRSGIPSEVDRKTAERFGLAILTSMLPSGGDSIFSSSTSVAEEILKETLKTNPTADVPHSSIETTIFLARDLRLPKCYK